MYEFIYIAFVPVLALVLVPVLGFMCYRTARSARRGAIEMIFYYGRFGMGVFLLGLLLSLTISMRLVFIAVAPIAFVGAVGFICSAWWRARGIHMWASVILVVVVHILIGAGYMHRWSGVNDDMARINASLGLPAADPWGNSPHAYYRRHFESALVKGMPKHVAEHDVLIDPDDVYRSTDAQGNERVVYRYRIGTNGLAHGHDVFVRIRYSDGCIASVAIGNS